MRVETDRLIAFLNSLIEIDPYAMAELLTLRVPCNQAMADHPTVQVAAAGATTFIAPQPSLRQAPSAWDCLAWSMATSAPKTAWARSAPSTKTAVS